ncbi:hypothetical protein OTU49_000958, partial [Cherax quadricarinatus]
LCFPFTDCKKCISILYSQETPKMNKKMLTVPVNKSFSYLLIIIILLKRAINLCWSFNTVYQSSADICSKSARMNTYKRKQSNRCCLSKIKFALKIELSEDIKELEYYSDQVLDPCGVMQC